jgi:hypothetical protein
VGGEAKAEARTSSSLGRELPGVLAAGGWEFLGTSERDRGPAQLVQHNKCCIQDLPDKGSKASRADKKQSRVKNEWTGMFVALDRFTENVESGLWIVETPIADFITSGKAPIF